MIKMIKIQLSKDPIEANQAFRAAVYAVDRLQIKLREALGNEAANEIVEDIARGMLDAVVDGTDPEDEDLKRFALDHMDGILTGHVKYDDYIKTREPDVADDGILRRSGDAVDVVDPEECMHYMFSAMEDKLKELMPPDEFAAFMHAKSREAIRRQIIANAADGPAKDAVLEAFDMIMDNIEKGVKAPWE